MTRATRLLLIGAVLASLAGGLWAWRDRQIQQRRQRSDAWTQYLRGPLSQLLEGSYEGRTLLAAAQAKPLNQAQRQSLAQAAARLREADSALQPQMLELYRGAFFEPLKEAARWHAELAESAKDWPRLGAQRELITPALEAERGLRLRLAGALDRQRDQVLLSLKPSQEAVLEMNALLYSLKE